MLKKIGKFGQEFGSVALRLIARNRMALAAVLLLGWAAMNARADFTPVFGDPSTITAAATTAFTAIATFMIGVLGFWVIFRLVRKIRGS
jgi:hypothetical protein